MQAMYTEAPDYRQHAPCPAPAIQLFLICLPASRRYQKKNSCVVDIGHSSKCASNPPRGYASPIVTVVTTMTAADVALCTTENLVVPMEL